MSAQRGSDEASGSNQAGSSGSGDAVEEVCAFCLDSIPDKDACFSTACTHISHKVCLLRWLENNRTCATCRTPVEVVKMKSGKNVALPPLLPLPPEFIDPLTEEQMIAGVGLTSEEEDSHSSSSSEETEEEEAFDAVSFTRNQSRVRRPARVPRTRRSTRQSGQPVALSLEEEQREARIAGMATFIASGVGSTRSRRGGLAIRGRRAPGSRRRSSSTPSPHRPRGADFLLDDVEMDSPDEEAQAREEMRSFRTDEEEEGSESSGSETDTGSEESSGNDSEEDSGSEDSELDESVLDDQPSTSRQMIPIVRKKRGAKKKTTKRKRTTTKKKKSEGGTVKRKTKRRKTTKKGTKRGTKRKRTSREEASEQRQRIRAAFPSLSLNGAAMDPISADEADEPPAPKIARVAPPPPPAAVSDPTDLLGSIFTSQVIAHAHGRHLKQEDGKLVPRDSFNRHLARLERRGILPVDRAEVAPSSSSSLPSSSRPVPAPRPTGIATTRTGASTISSSSVLTDRPRVGLPMREPNTSRPISRPLTTSSDSTPRAVPLVSPFERSTPLPRIYRPTPLTPMPPAPSRRPTALPPPPPPSRQKLPSGYSRDTSFRDVKKKCEDDKKDVARIVKDRMQSERSHQIREAVNSILISERRERRITDDEYRLLKNRITKRFFDKLLFERERVVEWTRIELGKLLEEKMFAPVTVD